MAIAIMATCSLLAAGVPVQAQLFGSRSESSRSAGSDEGGWTLPMPKITMPKISMPTLSMPAIPKLAMPEFASAPFEPIKASARKVTDGSKRAWEGAKEIFTFGRDDSTRVASRDQPSVWQRMTGTSPPQDDGPQTIGEFMSGTRPK